MTTLHIDSSITGSDSVSRRLTRAIVSQLAAGEIAYHDLAADPLPHLTARGQDPELLNQFIAADTVVIGAPMYNFSVPTQLKAWLDRLAVAAAVRPEAELFLPLDLLLPVHVGEDIDRRVLAGRAAASAEQQHRE